MAEKHRLAAVSGFDRSVPCQVEFDVPALPFEVSVREGQSATVREFDRVEVAAGDPGDLERERAEEVAVPVSRSPVTGSDTRRANNTTR